MHSPMVYFRAMNIAVCTFDIVAVCLFWRRGREWRSSLAAAIALLFNPIRSVRAADEAADTSLPEPVEIRREISDATQQAMLARPF